MRALIVFTIALLWSWPSVVLANPAAPGEFQIADSDGTSFLAEIHGDEFQNWVEATGSGHTVVFSQNSGHWEYAVKNPDGALAPSGMRVDPTGRSAPESIEKGLKPSRDQEGENRHNEGLDRIYKKRQPPEPGAGHGNDARMDAGNDAAGEAGNAGGRAGSVEAASDAEADAGSDTGADAGVSGDPTSTSSGSDAAAPIVAQPVSGSRKLLVVLVSFADRDIITPASAWGDAIFHTAKASVARYYLDNSFGKLSITPVSHSQAGQPAGVVSVKLSSASSAAESTWVAEAINSVAAWPINVDFSALDVDGDGIIDGDEAFIYFIAAGYEESSHATQTPHVWAHATIYSSGGITAAGKIFPRYAMNGELNAAEHQMPIGVMAHELGHELCGLPDLYDTTYYNAGLGNFSVMAGGSWGFVGNGDDHGAKPVALDAWSREFLGWSLSVSPSGTQQLSFESALSSPTTAVKLVNPPYRSTEYWLAENRHPASGSWDQGIAGLLPGYAGGLLITHVDNGIGTASSNNFNTYRASGHQGVVPEQASISPCDMLASGSANVCRGSSRTTFYASNNISFGQSTVPNSSYYSGTSSGMAINNISACGATMTASVTITVSPDTTKPAVTAFTLPAAWNNLTVPVTLFTASDNVAVSAYLITASTTAPDASDSRWNASPPTGYTFTSTGSKSLYAWVKDSSNNVSSYRLATVTIDVTAPYISSYSIPGIYSALTVPVSLTGYDNSKLIAGYYLSESATTPGSSDAAWMSSKPASYRFASGGVHTLYAWVKDKAGNVSPSKSATVSIDAIPPTVDSFSVPPLVTALTIPVKSFAAADDSDGSGIAGYRITETATAPLASASGWSLTPPTSYTTSAGGSKTLYAWAKDKAGGVSAGTTAAVFVDVSKPVVTTFTVPAACASLTVPVSALIATDNLAVAAYLITESSTAPLASDPRWQPTPPTAYAASAAGKKTLYAWAKDSAGYVSACKIAYVVIDLTPPVLSYFAIPTSYTALTISVSVKASDNIAVAGYYLSESPSTPLSSEAVWKSRVSSYTFSSAGVHTLYAWCKDTAGNVSLAKSATVVIK